MQSKALVRQFVRVGFPKGLKLERHTILRFYARQGLLDTFRLTES